jgi:hypothetical protein
MERYYLGTRTNNARIQAKKILSRFLKKVVFEFTGLLPKLILVLAMTLF